LFLEPSALEIEDDEHVELLADPIPEPVVDSA
jgi:hypothetical protein